MSTSVSLARSPMRSAAPYVAANAATVGTLYLMQALVAPTVAEFGASPAILLMPGATLAGYAIGVGLSASIARDLTDPRGLAMHLLWLTASLWVAAWAWTPALEACACLMIGLGCSLTQRLLASATSAVPSERRAEAIAWIIASGLGGIVIARAGMPAVAALGRHALLLSDACVVALSGVACLLGMQRAAGAAGARPGPAWSLWRQHRGLRAAAVQQAGVFAAYNLGWALYPRVAVLEHGSAAALAMGSVAGLGACAALLSGRWCARRDPAGIANRGFLAILAAGALAAIAGHIAHVPDGAMVVLDTATQIALVANQSRAQSCATTPAVRGRMSAMVTTLGFLGGAAGSAAGNLLH